MCKKISVIMGVLNEEESVEKAVLSIINQTEQNIEFIICDDGSTDSTYAILQRLNVKYSNIVLLKNETNRGLAFSLNRCLEIASGEYVARMDADDISKRERLELQKKFLDEHLEYDLVGCEMVMVDDKQKKTYSKNEREPTANVFPIRTPFSHATIMIRRGSLQKLGGYSVEKITRRCEDIELWYRFFEAGMKGYNLPDYLYIRIQSSSDYKKKKGVRGIEFFQMHMRGLKRINAPFYKYVLAIKPIISAMIPKKIMMKYHELKFSKKG